MTDPNYDPLEGYESVPSVSFDPAHGGPGEGEFITLAVTDYIKLVQDKNKDGTPKVYPDSGKPVLKFVLPVELDGEPRALWGAKLNYDTSLMGQLVAAQKAVKAQTGDPSRRLGPGCVIKVAWAWNTALEKKLGNYPKKYKVDLVSVGSAPAPVNDPLGGDPWSSSTPAAAEEPPF